MTPGTYLRLRRKAAGLTIKEVAALLPTDPRKPEHERAEWIVLIERDEMPAAFHTIVALRRVFMFDLEVLESLVEMPGYPSDPLPVCRGCGCSEDDACGGGCWWAEPDLCSTCLDPVARVDAMHAIAAGQAAA